MAYTDDAVLAKLSALNETQESIVSPLPPSTLRILMYDKVTVAQWVMFHRQANSASSNVVNANIRYLGDMQIELGSSGCSDSKTPPPIRD